MMKSECDRCGKQEETPNCGAAVSMFGPRLPEGWRRVLLPQEMAEVQGERKELCPACLAALRQFFEGDGAVPGLLEPETLDAVDPEQAGRDMWPEPDAEGLEEPEPEEGEHEHDFDRLHGICRCGSTYGDVMRRTAELNGQTFVGVDPAAPFGQRIPVGSKTAPCPNADEGRCPGVYTRGALHQHMEAVHGVRVSAESDACPFCPEIMKSGRLGQHIARQHPGHWQAWVDEQDQGARQNGAGKR